MAAKTLCPTSPPRPPSPSPFLAAAPHPSSRPLSVPPMAEFVPDLDDGELWLPAEIIPDVGLRRFHHASAAAAASRCRIRHPLDVERLAAFGPLDLVHLHSSALKLPPALPRRLEGFKPAGQACRREPKDRVLLMSLRQHGKESSAPPDAYGRRFEVGSRPEVVRPWPVDLAQVQLEEAFGRPAQRPLRPIQSSYGSVRPCAPRSERGGTGVFHPRVMTKNEAKKRYAAVEQQKQQQQQSTRSTVMWQQGNPFQLPSKMSLPQDWTY